MSGLFTEALAALNQLLTPLAPSGVSGVEFIAVFIIIYALMFILLERTKLFGTNRAARLLIALAGAYFTASSAFSTILISKLFPYLGIVTMLILGFIMVYSLFGTGPSIPFRNLVIIIAIGFIIWGAWSATGSQINLGGLSMPQLETSDWYFIIFIIIFLAVLILIGIGIGGEGGSKFDGKKIWSGIEGFLKGLTKD